MTNKIIYAKAEERAIVDAHLNAMATCIWPSCTKYKAQDFQLCPDHIRSAAIYRQQHAPRQNIPAQVKQKLRQKQEADLTRYLNNEPLRHDLGYIYALRSDKLIKIGHTETPQMRLRQYSPGAQVLVLFPGNRLVEKHIHNQFAHLLVKGREWFKEADELAAWIRGKQEDHGEVPTSLNEGRFRDAHPIREARTPTTRPPHIAPEPGKELRRRFQRYNQADG